MRINMKKNAFLDPNPPHRPLFDGMCDIDVLAKVFALCGTPSDTNWPAARELPAFLQFTETKPLPLRQVFPAVSEDQAAASSSKRGYAKGRSCGWEL